MPFTVYILFSQKSNRYYIGFTGEVLAQRLKKHLTNHSGFTGRAKDWVVAYEEYYVTKQEAFERERQIKGWKSSKMITELINRGSQARPDKSG